MISTPFIKVSTVPIKVELRILQNKMYNNKMNEIKEAVSFSLIILLEDVCTQVKAKSLCQCVVASNIRQHLRPPDKRVVQSL